MKTLRICVCCDDCDKELQDEYYFVEGNRLCNDCMEERYKEYIDYDEDEEWFDEDK